MVNNLYKWWHMTAQSRLDIIQLVARYTHNVDRGKADLVATMFAPDGRLATPKWEARGPTEIQERLTDPALMLKRMPRFVRHHISSHLVELVDEDHATGRAYYMVITDIGPDHAGSYLDRYVRCDGIWHFEDRAVRLDWCSADSLFLVADQP